MYSTDTEVMAVLGDVLGPQAVAGLRPESALLGSVAELDSMAVVGILTAIEERFGIVVNDDDVDGSTFATVSSLVGFVRSKLPA